MVHLLALTSLLFHQSAFARQYKVAADYLIGSMSSNLVFAQLSSTEGQAVLNFKNGIPMPSLLRRRRTRKIVTGLLDADTPIYCEFSSKGDAFRIVPCPATVFISGAFMLFGDEAIYAPENIAHKLGGEVKGWSFDLQPSRWRIYALVTAKEDGTYFVTCIDAPTRLRTLAHFRSDGVVRGISVDESIATIYYILESPDGKKNVVARKFSGEEKRIAAVAHTSRSGGDSIDSRLSICLAGEVDTFAWYLGT